MKGPLTLGFWCLMSSAVLLSGTAEAQDMDASSPTLYTNASEAADMLRHLYFDRDQAFGHAQGEQLIARFPEDFRLRAWAVLNAAGAGSGDDALALAEEMVASKPDYPWARFAMAAALVWAGDNGEEALDASRKALAVASPHPDFVWLHAEALLNHAGEEEAIEYIDDQLAELDNPAELLALKGYALFSLSRQNQDDPSLSDRAAAAYTTAQALDSTSFNAWWLQAVQLSNARRVDEAYPLLRRAARLSNSPSVHSRYWRAIQGLTALTPEEKQAAIEEDIGRLLAERPHVPDVLLQVANTYGELGLDDRKEEMERRILEDHPVTVAAEWVFVERYRAFEREHGEALFNDAALRETYAAMLRDFIARPEHVRDRLLGDAYRQLFHITRDDSTLSDEEFAGVVDGMVAYEGINPHVTYAGGALALAERKTHFRRAEQLAREGVEVVRKKLEADRDRFDTQGDYENSLNWLTSMMYDALGWVYFNEGRLEDAETELLRAYELFQESRDNLYHLGKLYEVKHEAYGMEEEAGNLPGTRLYPGDHDLGKAEGYYIKGLAVQRPGDNPNEKALQSLYRHRYGSLEGFDAYRSSIEEIDRRHRRETVLGDRIAEPKPVAPFALATLEGDTLSSAALAGKTTVINFWGIWCGWCVKEMPDFQELRERYREASDVMILTINNDTNPDEVVTWMEEKEYDFPVLLDRGYASQSGVQAYPTTWFIDPHGRIAFVKRGWSEKLLEEFAWRIEALRTRE